MHNLDVCTVYLKLLPSYFSGVISTQAIPSKKSRLLPQSGLCNNLLFLLTFHFRPDLVIKWKRIPHIVNAVSIFDRFRGGIGDR